MLFNTVQEGHPVISKMLQMVLILWQCSVGVPIFKQRKVSRLSGSPLEDLTVVSRRCTLGPKNVLFVPGIVVDHSPSDTIYCSIKTTGKLVGMESMGVSHDVESLNVSRRIKIFFVIIAIMRSCRWITHIPPPHA